MNRLISMVKYTLKRTSAIENTKKDTVLSLVLELKRYARFLNLKIDMGMFVPCDVMGDILLEPNDAYYPARPELYAASVDEYEAALGRIMFPGFRIINWPSDTDATKTIVDELGIIHIAWLDSITNEWRLSRGLKRVEDLVRSGLEYKL